MRPWASKTCSRGFSAGLPRHWALCLISALMIVAVASPSGATGASPSRVVTARSIIDPACDGGAGTVIPAPRSWLAGAASVATTMLPRGITLVMVSSVYPPASFAVVHAFTSSCAPDPAFGDNGVERLALGGLDFNVSFATPALGGGAILVGRSGSGWIVARIEASGRLDPAFGKGGWAVLPWPGGASAVAQAPTGDIVVGGSVDGRCCQQEWVGELNERGALVARFGPGGRVRLPVYLEYSSITRVAVEPGGDILALSVGGHMGIWGVTVTALTADGLPVPWFQRNFNAAITHALPSQIYVGDLVVDRHGFLLVGTAQGGPVTNVLSPTATGYIVAFRPNGSLDASFAASGEARFSSVLEDPLWALPQLDGGILVVGMTPALQAAAQVRAHLNLVDLSKSGDVARGYGHDGVGQLQLPFVGQSPASFVPVSVTTNGKVSLVVASTADVRALKLVEFRS